MEEEDNQCCRSLECSEHEEEFADTLSFCNLQVGDGNENNSQQQSPRTSSASQEARFEFFSCLTSQIGFSNPDIIFCGKIIHEEEEEQLNEYQKRDYLTTIRSSSFRKPLSFLEETNMGVVTKRQRSTSLRYPNCHAQKVNITSLTSMSPKSKRRMFMFGPVKFKPEMELSAIKQRQRRRAQITQFPAADMGGEAAMCGGRLGRKGGGHWGLLRTLRGRAHLTTALAKSFGCIPAPADVERVLSLA